MSEQASVPRRPRQAYNRDNAFFAEGLRDGVVLIQRCSGCGALRHPPRPMCPKCQCFEWDTVTASGRGEIYSYAVHWYPPLPGITTPSRIVLVQLEEGMRMVGNLIDGGEDDLKIGAQVEAAIVADPGDDMPLVQWRPAQAQV
jgi:uncharacterized OB-fold protein